VRLRTRRGPAALSPHSLRSQTGRPYTASGAVSSADLANVLLTTAVETCGWFWIVAATEAPSGPVRRPVVDPPGLAKPSEKRKVGGSTPPLTTTPLRR